MSQPHTIHQLSPAAIAPHVAECASHVALEVVAETGSTNADLLQRVHAAALSAPVLLIAENQTAGKGRAGRAWLSAPGATLTFSLAWRFKGPLQNLVGLPLAVGVALAEAIAALGVPVLLKWPNDLLKDGAKLAGILVETQNAPNGEIWAVIGAGVNLLMPDRLEADIGREVASAPWLAQMDRNQLMAALLNRLSATLAEFDDTGFAAFTERWNALQAWRGQQVTIIDRGQVLHEGRAAGVDELGRLLLDTDAGRVPVLSGDVSLRLAP
ncbi:biotin--[acetyl-CoA-carboxylase] ligase [Pseudoduganella namucuonensis]|uniref:biotin--[biotin carboxyl-carrier protein] ligase n=1 Tax=Pseudoduganella namucuonensis TaxID=1035707 RepID=A0A1I7ETF4_9BURK|nr:biotin--[acetyl-CoA-carboxylase] ligase [Pseudoduganella namucuonensis]SFU27216.1 BirA family transcriptional regulator, biotin operon repressor / biotin-[acetyl-CoA-carboxylase] ligase [Pseudoduganella namucuonensis]